MTTNSPEDLAARLDEILPPGRVELDDSPSDPVLRAALELARDPRPVLSAAARARIQRQVLARADHVFAPRAIMRRRVFFAARWAAASVAIVCLAALLITTFTGDSAPRPAPVANHAPTNDEVIIAPSAPDSVVFIPQDAIAASLTEIGTGTTSIFVQPLTP